MTLIADTTRQRLLSAIERLTEAQAQVLLEQAERLRDLSQAEPPPRPFLERGAKLHFVPGQLFDPGQLEEIAAAIAEDDIQLPRGRRMGAEIAARAGTLGFSAQDMDEMEAAIFAERQPCSIP